MCKARHFFFGQAEIQTLSVRSHKLVRSLGLINLDEHLYQILLNVYTTCTRLDCMNA